MTTVHVATGRPYDVVIGHDLIERAGALIAPFAKRGRVAVVTDDNVSGLHGARLAESLEAAGIAGETLVVPPGEESKSFDGLAALSDASVT